jgi:hypothetical protein
LIILLGIIIWVVNIFNKKFFQDENEEIIGQDENEKDIE